MSVEFYYRFKVIIVGRDLFWLQGGRKNNDKHFYRLWKNQSHNGNLLGFYEEFYEESCDKISFDRDLF
jgi:hypothetical protein